MEFERESLDETVYTIDDGLWERLIEVTDGAAAPCYQCGVCTAACPWGEVREEPLSVRTFMRRAQLGLEDGNETLWLCTTCAQCESYCPRGVNICEVFRGLRSIAWENRTVVEGLPSLLWSIHWNGNPWTQPPSQRTDWAKGFDVPVFDSTKHDILLYIGCTSSYDRRAQKIARALVKLLRSASVKFGTLGEEEPCCGESALSVGHKPYFEEIASNTIQVFKDKGVSNLVTISPHCYDVFVNHYPNILEQDVIRIHHYTQYLAHLLEEEKLQFNRKSGISSNGGSSAAPKETIQPTLVTFQDPCYLGRHNQEYQAPREVLESIDGVKLVEMEHNTEDGLCCGGGGGRMWLETEPGERFSDMRVQEAAKTGANVLATACPFCVVCLEDSLKAAGERNLEVLDVAEFAALNL